MPETEKKGWGKLKPNIDTKIIARRMRKAEGATIKHAHKFIVKRWDNVLEAQRNIVIWIITIAVIIAATGFQLTWNQHSYETATSTLDGVYAEAVLGSVDTLNPLFATSAAEQSAGSLIYSRILKYDTTGHLGYDLATDININQNTYTVKLRHDVKWQDGQTLTAEDIIFTINLMKNPLVRSTVTGWDSVSVKAIDKYTVEFTLPSAFAAFEHALTFAILPEHVLSKVSPVSIRESDFSKNPIGSGPFKLDLLQDASDQTKGEKVVHLLRNDDYYGSRAKLMRYQIHSYKTADDVISSLAQGEVNSAIGLSSGELKRVDNKRYAIVVKPIQTGVYAIFNLKSQVLQDISVRRALRQGTDTDTIRRDLPKGTPKMDYPLTDDQLKPDLPVAPTYSQAESRKMLDDNGWKLNSKGIREKDGKQLKLSVVAVKNGELERTLEIISGQWRALGVAVDTKVIDLTDASQVDASGMLQQRAYDVLIYQLNIGADPDVYAYWHSSQISTQGLNFANYSNPITDDALLSARARIEPSLRHSKYITFAKQWLNDVPAIGLYQSTIDYVVSRNATSFNHSNILVSPTDRYADILDWSVGSRKVYKTP